MRGSDVRLHRAIGLPHATALVVGTIIGASIFVQPSEITGQVPSIGGILAVWLVSGLLTIFGSLVCAELASMFTRSGGVYLYLKTSYSPALGFLWGWAMFWTMHSGIIAAISVVFARYVGFFAPLGPTQVKAVAILAIVALTVVNMLGVKHGSLLQTLFTVGKLLAIVLIIVAGFVLGSRIPQHFVPASQPGPVSVESFTLALIAGLFAFGGWHMVTYSAEETVEPEKTIPRALIIGPLIVTVSYVALNTAYLYVLPLDKVASSTRVAADAADALLGFGGGAVMSSLVIFSTFGALSGIVLAGPRVYYSMARDGLLFSWLGDVHPRFRTPHRALIAQAVWSAVLVGTGTYRALFTRVIYTEWIFFGLMAIGLMRLRRRRELERRYAVWGYPMVPLVFVASSFAIVIVHFASSPRQAALGLLFVLAGLPVYYFWVHKSRKENAP